MENTNNNNNEEARRRRNGGHARGRGGLRGSMAARSGVTKRGRKRSDRPSVSGPVFCDMLENLPEGQPLEIAMHAKRVRVLPAAVPKNPRSESLWSSLEMIAPSTSSTSWVRKTPSPIPTASLSPHNLSAAVPKNPRSESLWSSLEMIAPSTSSTSWVRKTPSPIPTASLSPHNLSAAVPKNPRSESLWSSLEMIAPSTSSTSWVRKTPSPIPTASLSPHNLPAAVPIILDESVPSPALYVECTMGSGASTPNSTRPESSRVRDRLSNIRRPLRDDEISCLLNYGSEEESDEEEEGFVQSAGVPRTARMFMEEEDEEVEGNCVDITLEWPPQPPRPSICDPTPALSSPASPAPEMRISMEPSEKFKFDWRPFPMPQIEPRLRRETFSQNIGPTVSFTNPFEAFTAIWDREILEVIVRETNIYAQQLTTTMLENGSICPNSRITRWQDTNVNEVYTYLAIVMAMGVVVQSRIEEYWNSSKDIFSTPGFSMNMTYDRFQLLSKCLHFNNNINCNIAVLTRPQAKLFKIQPILDHLNAKFSQLYNLSQNVALDESLTLWKGWLDINQFIHNKAAVVGIKTYEVCESKTGYLWRFEVHAGHDISAVQEDDPVSGIVPALVLRLLNGLEHKGHTIWMDNFYNSPALARELKIRGFDCVGTLRTNRQFVPSELASITKKDMTIGQAMGCTSGDVDLILWRDKNRVAFITTYHGLATTSCGNTLKPTVVQDYNICMGGVDRKDQQLSMYPIERRRTRVWYKKFFRHLLNVSVLNAYILLNQNKSLTHRKFRKALIIDLLAAFRAPAPDALTPAVLHCPAQYDLIKAGKSNRLKRQCTVCKKRTITYCKSCNVAMCIFTCYEPYHTALSS